jgi:hypothetical protein
MYRYIDIMCIYIYTYVHISHINHCEPTQIEIQLKGLLHTISQTSWCAKCIYLDSQFCTRFVRYS